MTSYSFVSRSVTDSELNRTVLRLSSKAVVLWLQTKDNKMAWKDVAILSLSFVLPPVSVGLKTDWSSSHVMVNSLMTLCLWIPGVIHANRIRTADLFNQK